MINDNYLKLVDKYYYQVKTFCDIDSETSLIYIRKMCESICQNIFINELDSDPASKTLQNFIDVFTNKKTIDLNIIVMIRTIQNLSNPSAHASTTDYKNVLRTAITAHEDLYKWFKEEYLKKSSISEIENKVINIGCIPFPPFINYKKVDGVYLFEGIYKDILDVVSQDTGYNFNLLPVQNHHSIEMLGSKKVDFIICLLVSNERLQKFDFIARNYRTSVGGLTKENLIGDINVRSLKNGDYRIAVCKGEIGDSVLKNIINIDPTKVEITELGTHNVKDAIRLVEFGLCDIAITDNITCQDYLFQNPETTLKNAFLQIPLYSNEIGIMANKENETLNNWLENYILKASKNNTISNKENDMIVLYNGSIQYN